MKTKMLLFLACTALIVCQARAQYRMVAGKVYSLNDPSWTVFNCYLEVVQTSGNDVICRPFTVASSSHTVFGHNVNGRTAGVVSESHRVYHSVLTKEKRDVSSIALRNYGLCAIGTCIYPPIYAMENGTTGVSTTQRTGGIIDQTVNSSQSYVVFDMGVIYTPPSRPLTPEEKIAHAKKIAEQNIKAFEFMKKEAEGGSPAARLSLGYFYLKGKGCEVDTNEAKRWFRLSAIGGNTEAADQLEKLTNAANPSVTVTNNATLPH